MKLGLLAVGGPAAHVALMRREIVVKRRWLDEKQFLDGFAACQLIPGPSSTELAILLGYRRGGPAGLVVAGTLFILPAMILMLVLAWIYVRFASSVALSHALQDVRPVVVGVMGWALLDLARRMITGAIPLLLALAVALGALLGANPVALLALGGLAIVIWRTVPSLTSPRAEGTAPAGLLLAASGPINTSLVGIFLAFLKYGLVSFGGGYVLFAFLHSDVVETFHWLTTRQLIDAIALSQATPGPVFTIAAFIGFLVAGLGGAVVATVGIFLPAFMLVPFLDRIVRLIQERRWASALLEGVNVAALGLIAAVAIELGRSSLIDPITFAIAGASFLVLMRAPLAAPALVVGGGLLGLVGLR